MTDYDQQRDDLVEDLDVTDDEAGDVKGGIIAVRKAGGPTTDLKLDGISSKSSLNWT